MVHHPDEIRARGGQCVRDLWGPVLRPVIHDDDLELVRERR